MGFTDPSTATIEGDGKLQGTAPSAIELPAGDTGAW
jgi:hypothetical protein